jgi:hypothetical protein
MTQLAVPSFRIDRNTFALGLHWNEQEIDDENLKAAGARLKVNRKIQLQTGYTLDPEHRRGQWSAASVAAANEKSNTWFGIFDVPTARGGGPFYWLVTVEDGVITRDDVLTQREAIVTSAELRDQGSAKWGAIYANGITLTGSRQVSLTDLLQSPKDGRLQMVMIQSSVLKVLGLGSLGVAALAGGIYAAAQAYTEFSKPSKPLAAPAVANVPAPTPAAGPGPTLVRVIRHLPDPAWFVETCANLSSGMINATAAMAGADVSCKPNLSTPEITVTIRRPGTYASGLKSLTALQELPPDATQPDSGSGYTPATTIAWLRKAYRYRDTIQITQKEQNNGPVSLTLVAGESSTDWGAAMEGKPVVITSMTFKSGVWTLEGEVR